MIAFQLDQCLDSRRFVRDCVAEGLCQLQRLPRVLRGAKDPEMLRAVMTGSSTLLTFDRSLPHKHTRCIPASHPGIIVLSNYPSLKTLTVAIAQKILHQFKSTFPDWHGMDLRNSIVEITSLGAEVWHVSGGKLVRDAYVSFDAGDWQQRLSAMLDMNARRGA